MKFSLGWLRDHLQLDDARLVEGLYAAGFPIDAYHDRRLGELFVVAQINSIVQHPGADRLKVCVVYDGTAEHQIVCGDPGIQVGQITVLALPGARLPCGKEIVRSKIRGVESSGMLCGADEIGVASERDGVMSLDAQVGVTADSVLHPDGPEWSIEVEYNRRDMLSVRGVAQEIAAYSGVPMIERVCIDRAAQVSHIKNEIDGAMVVVMQCELKDGATPEWMARRLALQGVQSKGLWAIDVTNYVAHDIGHPLHAFDADKLQGTLVARFANAGEQLELLSGESITLQGGEPVFADSVGVVSLVGVMGGVRTACDASTKRVLFESTYLDRSCFAGGPRLNTHARKLCTRGADLEGPLSALGRVSELSLGYGFVCPAEVVGEIDERAITIDPDKVACLIGQKVDVDACLKRLGFVCVGPNQWRIPSWRADVSIQEDIAEEVARMHGYNKIAVREIKYQPKIIRPDCMDILRTALASTGLYEVMNSSVVLPELSPKGVPVNDTRRLRSSMIPGLYKSCVSQIARRVTQFVGAFEIGTCFGYEDKYGFDYAVCSDGRQVYQWQSLGIVLNPVQDGDIDRYLGLISELLNIEFVSDAKNALPEFAHPNIGYCLASERGAGWVGAIDPSLTYPQFKECMYGLELRIPLGMTGADLTRVSQSHPHSQSTRDLTFVFDGHARDLQAALCNGCPANSGIRLMYIHGNAMTFRCMMSVDDAAQSHIDAIVDQYIQAAQRIGALLQKQ